MNCIKELHKPIVFIHIPKTAGTAFVSYLHNNIGKDNVAPPLFKNDITAAQMRIKEFKLYWGHCPFSKINPVLPNAYYLTFLRHPFNRVISQYKSWHNPKNLTEFWLSRMTSEEKEDIKFAQSATLEEFILSERQEIVSQINDVQTIFLSSTPDASNMLQSAIENLQNFYYFGITEKFNESILLFRSLFDNTHPYNIPEIAENRSQVETSSLSDQAKQRIYDLNQNDFKLYDFAVSLFNKSNR